MQARRTVETGVVAGAKLVPEEFTAQRIDKVIRDRYPGLPDEDWEAIPKRAVAATTLTQKGGAEVRKSENGSAELMPTWHRLTARAGP